MGADGRQNRCCFGIRISWFQEPKAVNLKKIVAFYLFPTETAVNVGYACKLMDPDTTLIQGEELRSENNLSLF